MTGTAASDQILSYEGNVLSEDKTFDEYKLEGDVKIRMAPKKPAFTHCPKKHPLVLKAIPPWSDWYMCDPCGTKYGREVNSWRCDDCDFDVCQACATIKAPNYKLKHNVCGNDHTLIYSVFCMVAYNSGLYSCSICHTNKSCIEGRWHCTMCHYDVCKVCQS